MCNSTQKNKKNTQTNGQTDERTKHHENEKRFQTIIILLVLNLVVVFFLIAVFHSKVCSPNRYKIGIAFINCFHVGQISLILRVLVSYARQIHRPIIKIITQIQRIKNYTQAHYIKWEWKRQIRRPQSLIHVERLKLSLLFSYKQIIRSHLIDSFECFLEHIRITHFDALNIYIFKFIFLFFSLFAVIFVFSNENLTLKSDFNVLVAILYKIWNHWIQVDPKIEDRHELHSNLLTKTKYEITTTNIVSNDDDLFSEFKWFRFRVNWQIIRNAAALSGIRNQQYSLITFKYIIDILWYTTFGPFKNNSTDNYFVKTLHLYVISINFN